MIFLSMTIYLCSPFTMINESDHEWTVDDAKSIVSSSTTCKIRYSSCLKTFIKKDEKSFNAICR